MSVKNRISGGVYLVLDPSVEKTELLEKLEQALNGGVNAVQIWNHWPDSFSQTDKEELVTEILSTSKDFDVPVLINNEWQLLKTTDLDGVHFDEIPGNYQQIQAKIGREFIAGITCSNDADVIRRANETGFDYISFCSMFPSSSVDSCEIVRPETIRKARNITDMPLFVSGGITPENLTDLGDLDFQGVAVISGILNSDSPERSTKDYQKVLNEMSPFEGGEKRKSVSGG